MIVASDPYPSRTNARAAILPRHDPVVYGDAPEARGPLSREQIARYASDGYLAFTDFFTDAEVRAWREEFRRLAHAEELRARPETILEPDSGVVRSIFAVHRLSAVYRRLLKDPRIVDLARQLLDGEVYIHQTRINVKPGFRGREFYWHSDFETWHVEDGMPRMRAISCVIALTDNIQQNGPLMLIPGSHRRYVSCPGETPERHYEQSLRKQEVGVPDDASLARLVDEAGDIAAPTGPAGSLVLFDCNVMHGSNGNITPYPRTNLFFVYNSVENTLVEPFCGLPPRPDYIGSHDFTPVAAAPD